GQVGHGADRAVVPPPLEADGADGGVALGDADTEVEFEPALAPRIGQRADPVAHARGHADGPRGRIRQRPGSLKKIIIPSPVKRSSVPSASRISFPISA